MLYSLHTPKRVGIIIVECERDANQNAFRSPATLCQADMELADRPFAASFCFPHTMSMFRFRALQKLSIQRMPSSDEALHFMALYRDVRLKVHRQALQAASRAPSYRAAWLDPPRTAKLEVFKAF